MPPTALPGAIIGGTTTQWSKEATWPNEPREHATQLSKYLRKALVSIENAKGQPVPAELEPTTGVTYTRVSRTCALMLIIHYLQLYTHTIPLEHYNFLKQSS